MEEREEIIETKVTVVRRPALATHEIWLIQYRRERRKFPIYNTYNAIIKDGRMVFKRVPEGFRFKDETPLLVVSDRFFPGFVEAMSSLPRIAGNKTDINSKQAKDYQLNLQEKGGEQ